MAGIGIMVIGAIATPAERMSILDIVDASFFGVEQAASAQTAANSVAFNFIGASPKAVKECVQFASQATPNGRSKSRLSSRPGDAIASRTAGTHGAIFSMGPG